MSASKTNDGASYVDVIEASTEGSWKALRGKTWTEAVEFAQSEAGIALGLMVLQGKAVGMRPPMGRCWYRERNGGLTLLSQN